jgi:hypothetical protein
VNRTKVFKFQLEQKKPESDPRLNYFMHLHSTFGFAFARCLAAFTAIIQAIWFGAGLHAFAAMYFIVAARALGVGK